MKIIIVEHSHLIISDWFYLNVLWRNKYEWKLHGICSDVHASVSAYHCYSHSCPYQLNSHEDTQTFKDYLNAYITPFSFSRVLKGKAAKVRDEEETIRLNLGICSVSHTLYSYVSRRSIFGNGIRILQPNIQNVKEWWEKIPFILLACNKACRNTYK